MVNNSPNILLVDDEMVWLKLFERNFRARGYQNVTSCQDGHNAVHLLSNNQYDLVVFDLVMPGYTGDDLLLKALELNPKAPVIIISGMILANDAERFKRLGAYGYCVKTDSPDDVFAMVESALSGPPI